MHGNRSTGSTCQDPACPPRHSSEDEYWLVKDGPRLWVGPFDGPTAEEDAHDFRLIHLPNHGFYITRQGPGRIFGISKGAADYIKRNLL